MRTVASCTVAARERGRHRVVGATDRGEVDDTVPVGVTDRAEHLFPHVVGRRRPRVTGRAARRGPANRRRARSSSGSMSRRHANSTSSSGEKRRSSSRSTSACPTDGEPGDADLGEAPRPDQEVRVPGQPPHEVADEARAVGVRGRARGDRRAPGTPASARGPRARRPGGRAARRHPRAGSPRRRARRAAAPRVGPRSCRPRSIRSTTSTRSAGPPAAIACSISVVLPKPAPATIAVTGRDHRSCTTDSRRGRRSTPSPAGSSGSCTAGAYGRFVPAVPGLAEVANTGSEAGLRAG